MTQSNQTSTPESGPEATPAPSTGPYVAAMAKALVARAGELGEAWAARGAAAVGQPDNGQPEPGDGSAAAEELVRTLVAAVEGGYWHETVMRAGWASGTRAYWRGVSLYQLLKEIDGGVALLLGAVDVATAEYVGPSTAADGLVVTRRLSDASSFLRLAAAGGYTRAMTDELRKRYRAIRHDLRNPLGTITSAVALMDDETVPEKTRQDPRMRQMVARNARSMEAKITAALGDSAAQLPTVAVQTTSLRDLVTAVRGDLSAAADGITVVVDDALPTFPLDSAGLELLLKAVVIAIARTVGGRAEVAIALEQLAPRSATLSVHAGPGTTRTGAPDLAFAEELMARLGGRVTTVDGTRVLLEIPIERRAIERVSDRQVSDSGAVPPRVDGSGRDARDDVAREGERPDGESRSL